MLRHSVCGDQKGLYVVVCVVIRSVLSSQDPSSDAVLSSSFGEPSSPPGSRTGT